MPTTSGVSSSGPTYGPVGAVTTPSTTQTSSSTETDSQTSKSSNEMNKDLFLKLLVAQMKYQDPSNPTDPTTFLSQTAEFTTVEKLNSLEQLGQRQMATSMIGKTVTYTDDEGKAHTGVVTGLKLGPSTTELAVGDAKVSLDDVISVTATPTTTGSGTA